MNRLIKLSTTGESELYVAADAIVAVMASWSEHNSHRESTKIWVRGTGEEPFEVDCKVAEVIEKISQAKMEQAHETQAA